MRTLGVALAVAMFAATGCADDGVYIEVLAPDGVTEVELFVVKGECDGEDTHSRPCTGGLQPQGFTAKVNAPIFIRAQKEGETWRIPVEDGSAWFRFGLDTTFPLQRVIAVGYENDRPVQAAVLAQVDLSRTRKVVVALEETVPWMTEEDAPGPMLAVKQWADRRCIGVRDAASSFFVVTEGDADCDELDRTAECDPLAYLVDMPEDSPCITTTGACSVGTWACSETNPGPTSNRICEPGNIDLDPDVCVLCRERPDDPMCIGDAVLQGVPYIECIFGYRESGPERPCPIGTLGHGPAYISRVSGAGPFCPAELGIAPSDQPFTGFVQEYEEPEWARVKVTRSDGAAPDCAKVEWFGVPIDGVDAVPDAKPLLFYSTGDMVGPNHVVPLQLYFEAGCEVPPQCTLITE